MSEQALHPNVRRALIPIILATLGVLAGMVISWEQPGRLVVGIVAVEAAALAVLIPFFAVWGRAWAGWFFPTICVITPPLSLAIAGSAAGGPGWPEPVRLVGAHAFLLAWAAMLAAAVMCVRKLGAGRSTAQLLVMLLAFAMIGTPFYANGFVETAPTPAVRETVVAAALWTNPWLIAAGSILEADPLRTKHLYSLSTIHLYGFRYPATGIASPALRSLALVACYGAVAGVLHGMAFALGRRRRN